MGVTFRRINGHIVPIKNKEAEAHNSKVKKAVAITAIGVGALGAGVIAGKQTGKFTARASADLWKAKFTRTHFGDDHIAPILKSFKGNMFKARAWSAVQGAGLKAGRFIIRNVKRGIL